MTCSYTSAAMKAVATFANVQPVAAVGNASTAFIVSLRLLYSLHLDACCLVWLCDLSEVRTARAFCPALQPLCGEP